VVQELLRRFLRLNPPRPDPRSLLLLEDRERVQLQELVEKTRSLLPVGPEHWLRKFEDEKELIAVVAGYEDIKNNPAWLHLSSKLFRLKDTFERAILRGEKTPDGRDLTPEMRSAYGLLMQILAIPGEAVHKHTRHEEEVMMYSETPSTE
jgi:hypothetical protein